MSEGPSLFLNWLQAQHISGKFDRRDQFGQVSQTRLDESVLLKMKEMEGDYEAEAASARFEEMALLFASFSTTPGAKEVFLKMFPKFAHEGEEDLDFFVPETREEMQRMMEEAKEMFLS